MDRAEGDPEPVSTAEVVVVGSANAEVVVVGSANAEVVVVGSANAEVVVVGSASAEVVVVGSANADLVIAVERRPAAGETVLGGELRVGPGGKGANQAVAAARLGARVAFVGCVGDDAYGPVLRGSLAAAGVDVTRLRVVAGATGTAVVLVDPAGDNSIVVSPGANAQVGVGDVEAAVDLLAAARVLVLQREVDASVSAAAAAVVERAGGRVLLSLAPSGPVPQGLLHLADPLLVNEQEARDLLAATGRTPAGRPDTVAGPADVHASEPDATAGAADVHASGPDAAAGPTDVRAGGPDAARGRTGTSVGGAVPEGEALARAVLAAGPRSAVVTLGAAGAVAAGPWGVVPVPAPAVRAVDTTGAGDALAGALAHRLAAGDEVPQALAYAVRVAALSVTRPGAQDSYPIAAELERPSGGA